MPSTQSEDNAEIDNKIYRVSAIKDQQEEEEEERTRTTKRTHASPPSRSHAISQSITFSTLSRRFARRSAGPPTASFWLCYASRVSSDAAIRWPLAGRRRRFKLFRDDRHAAANGNAWDSERDGHRARLPPRSQGVVGDVTEGRDTAHTFCARLVVFAPPLLASMVCLAAINRYIDEGSTL